MISRSADFESAASTDFAIQAMICGAQCETWTHKSFDSSFWDYSVYRFRQSRWCPFTESNYELIITSDLLCHLTKRALAGVAGIGPAHVRVKVWCLTSWLHPKIVIAQGYLWRRDRDSNPGYAHTHAGFQDRCLKPTRPSLLGTIVIISVYKRYINTLYKTTCIYRYDWWYMYYFTCCYHY